VRGAPEPSELEVIFSDSPEVLQRYRKFKDDIKNENDPLMMVCPEIECQEWVRAPNSRATEIKCGKCNTTICFKCKLKMHNGKTCYS
jgi:hypothetical protein